MNIDAYRRKIFIIGECVELFIAHLLIKFLLKSYYKKNIWIVGEKKTEARDNGYWFFKYVREKHPEIDIYYVITKDSPDLHKIKDLDNIIKYHSFRHFLYYSAALINIGSQPYGMPPCLVQKVMHKLRFLRRKNQKTVFLQHGIIKDELSHEFDYKNALFDIFVTSSSKEHDFIMKTYGYSSNNALLLGLCRFDNLHNPHNRLNNQILVMPTHRWWLRSHNVCEEASPDEKKQFKKSEFYREYSKLLSNKALIEKLKQYDFKIVFYPHYSLQSYIRCFKDLECDVVQIADREHFDVQQLLIESKLMITDFSSVYFDFAYMKKPEIFFQFDEERFREGQYKAGYFDYRRDGFGPVVKTVDEVIACIDEFFCNGQKVTDMYMERIDVFFDLNDSQNCKRTYEAITDLLGEGEK